eukprot:TRINITY_DN1045_c0_g1_i1.p1 TRINITY_DN1045_c0_g1~~TRINITY_DN1045_c0_g1_i1.p1  ORF type:complete len:575 (-),score=97.47 TRINITY_DN1045_c0_g1_i1:309-2033(-)
MEMTQRNPVVVQRAGYLDTGMELEGGHVQHNTMQMHPHQQYVPQQQQQHHHQQLQGHQQHYGMGNDFGFASFGDGSLGNDSFQGWGSVPQHQGGMHPMPFGTAGGPTLAMSTNGYEEMGYGPGAAASAQMLSQSAQDLFFGEEPTSAYPPGTNGTFFEDEFYTQRTDVSSFLAEDSNPACQTIPLIHTQHGHASLITKHEIGSPGSSPSSLDGMLEEEEDDDDDDSDTGSHGMPLSPHHPTPHPMIAHTISPLQLQPIPVIVTSPAEDQGTLCPGTTPPTSPLSTSRHGNLPLGKHKALTRSLEGTRRKRSVSANSGDRRTKRKRKSPEQLAVLESEFEANPMPNKEIREQLSARLGLTSRQVQIWFQNKRAKVKNTHSQSQTNSPFSSPMSSPRNSPLLTSRHAHMVPVYPGTPVSPILSTQPRPTSPNDGGRPGSPALFDMTRKMVTQQFGTRTAVGNAISRSTSPVMEAQLGLHHSMQPQQAQTHTTLQPQSPISPRQQLIAQPTPQQQHQLHIPQSSQHLGVSGIPMTYLQSPESSPRGLRVAAPMGISVQQQQHLPMYDYRGGPPAHMG